MRFLTLVLIVVGVLLASLGCEQQETQLTPVDELVALRDSAGPDYRWGDPNIPDMLQANGPLLYQDNFENLRAWHHEGRGHLSQPEPHVMQLNCVGSEQGGAGCMAFLKPDLPDSIVIEYDFQVLTTNGLLITFMASQGRRGEDMITELPERQGVFNDYILNPRLQSYHLSLSRYDDDGTHTGVSNWRRNPGIFLMAQQPDPCKIPKTWYHVTLVKAYDLLQLAIDGEQVGGFRDRHEIPTPIPRDGKIGFRAIGSRVIAQIKNLSVRKL